MIPGLHRLRATGVPALLPGTQEPSQVPRSPPPIILQAPYDVVLFSTLSTFHAFVAEHPAVRSSWVEKCLMPMKTGNPTKQLRVMHVVTGSLGTGRGTQKGADTMCAYAASQNELVRDVFSADGTQAIVYPVHLYSDDRFELPSTELQSRFTTSLLQQPYINKRASYDVELSMRIVEGHQENTKQDVRSLLDSVDVVYLGGGSTHWLLGRLVGSGFDDALSTWGGFVTGASSGANCLGVHTMLQAWKCSFNPGCDDAGDAALWTAEITNHTTVCGPQEFGACLFNALEATNRAHYCHFQEGDEPNLTRFYEEGNSSVTPYQRSIPLTLADGEAFLIGRKLFARSSVFNSDTLYERLPIAEHIVEIKQKLGFGVQSVVRNIQAAREFESAFFLRI